MVTGLVVCSIHSSGPPAFAYCHQFAMVEDSRSARMR